jgi:hypothetical protein
VRTVNTPILKIDDKTFNNPVTVLDAWADYFEDLATVGQSEVFSFVLSYFCNLHFPYCLCYLLASISSGNFEDLATPSEQQSFDSTFSALVKDDVDILTEIFTKYRQPMQEVTEEELSECISTFKNGKAQDESKITIEHLKYVTSYRGLVSR